MVRFVAPGAAPRAADHRRRTRPQCLPAAAPPARAPRRDDRCGARRLGDADAGTLSQPDRRARTRRHVRRRRVRRGTGLRARRQGDARIHRAARARPPCRSSHLPAGLRRRCSSTARRARSARSNVFTLLLAGIAVNAVCAAGTGFLSYIARDPQARNITFWNLGTFTTADWHGTLIVTVTFVVLLRVAAALRQGAQRADAGRRRGGISRASTRPRCIWPTAAW